MPDEFIGPDHYDDEDDDFLKNNPFLRDLEKLKDDEDELDIDLSADPKEQEDEYEDFNIDIDLSADPKLNPDQNRDEIDIDLSLDPKLDHQTQLNNSSNGSAQILIGEDPRNSGIEIGEDPGRYDALSDETYIKSKGFPVPKDANQQYLRRFAVMLRSFDKKNLGVNFNQLQKKYREGKIIRGEQNENEIDKLLSLIGEANNYLINTKYPNNGKLAKTKILVPHKEEFNFRKESESGKYILTNVFYDVEANQKQHAVAMEIINLEARRVTWWKFDKKNQGYTFDEIIQDDGSILQWVISKNPFDAFQANDIEQWINVTLTSALQEGNNSLNSIYKEMKKYSQIIRIPLLEENLYEIRKSNWIAHNDPFDVNKCIYRHKQQKKRLSHISKVEPKTVQLQVGSSTEYCFALGNSKVGYRFHTSTDSRFSSRLQSKIILAPHQQGTHSHVFTTDTVKASIALRNPGHSLKKLSKDLKYQKLDFDTAKKVFEPEDFYITENGELSPPTEYLHYDILSLMSVYEKLTRQLNYPLMEKVLSDHKATVSITQSIEPELSTLFSTATIAKKCLFSYLTAITDLTRRQIENNIVHERQYLKNFEDLYLGARTEVFSYGRSVEEVINDEVWKILYDDFASLYPHTAYLTLGMLQFILASKKELDNYLKTDNKTAINSIFKALKRIKVCVDKEKPLPRDLFLNLLGSVWIESSIPLQYPTRSDKKGLKGKRLEERGSGLKNWNMIDLLTALSREMILNNKSLKQLRKSIVIKRAEYFDFSDVEMEDYFEFINEDTGMPEYGSEFFSKLYCLRDSSKVAAKTGSVLKSKPKLQSKGVNDEVINKIISKMGEIWVEIKDSEFDQRAFEQGLKYVMNTGYGVSAEGISFEDFTGKLFISSIANLITACARFLASFLEIMIRHYDGIPLTSDTDSLIYKAPMRVAKKVRNYFSMICELKNEEDYGDIQSLFVAGKKRYGMLSRFNRCTQCIEIEDDETIYQVDELPVGLTVCPSCETESLEIYKKVLFKTFGKGQFDTKSWENGLEEHYRQILTPDENGNYSEINHTDFSESSAKELSVWGNITLKTVGHNSGDQTVQSLRKFFHKKRGHIIDKFEYQGIEMFLRYDALDDNFLVTNADVLSKSSFGYYWIARKRESTKCNWCNCRKNKHDRSIHKDNGAFESKSACSIHDDCKKFYPSEKKSKSKHNIKFFVCTVLPEEEYYDDGVVTDEFDDLVKFVYERYGDKELDEQLGEILEEPDIERASLPTRTAWHGFYEAIREHMYYYLQYDTIDVDTDFIEENEYYWNKLIQGLGYSPKSSLSQWFDSQSYYDYTLDDLFEKMKDDYFGAFSIGGPDYDDLYLLFDEISPEGSIFDQDTHLWLDDNWRKEYYRQQNEDIKRKKEKHVENAIKNFLAKNENNLVFSIYEQIFEIRWSDDLRKYIDKVNKKREKDGKKTMIGLPDVDPLFIRLDHMYNKQIKERDYLRDKMKRYFWFDYKRFMRERMEVSDHFSIMKVWGANDVLDEKPIRESVQRSKVNTDGWTYHYSFRVPNAFTELTTKTKMNANSYIETAISNLAYTGAKNYLATHYNFDCIVKISECSSQICEKEDHCGCGSSWKHNRDICNSNCKISELYLKDKHDTQTPKVRNAVYMPLRLKQIPRIEYHYICQTCSNSTTDIDIECCQEPLLNMYDARIQKSEFENVDGKFKDKLYKIMEDDNKYYLRLGDTRKSSTHKKLMNAYSKYKRNTWMEIEWMDQLWSIEILHYNSLSFNASLSIEIGVQKEGWKDTRVFQSHLHINPNSRNLLNIKLYKTSIKQIEDNSHIGEKIIKTLFDDLELTMFSQNASVNLDDLKIKKDMGYMTKMNYVSVAHLLLREKAHSHITSKLGEIAFTNQISLDERIDAHQFMDQIIGAVNLRYRKVLDQYKAENRLKKKQLLQRFVHKSSKGVTVRHFEENYAVSLYLKDSEWYENKALRLKKRRKATLSELKKIHQIIDNYNFDENVIRWEITLFGFENLHSSKAHQKLWEIENFIRTAINKYLENETLFKRLRSVTEEIAETIPDIIVNPDYKMTMPPEEIEEAPDPPMS